MPINALGPAQLLSDLVLGNAAAVLQFMNSLSWDFFFSSCFCLFALLPLLSLCIIYVYFLHISFSNIKKIVLKHQGPFIHISVKEYLARYPILGSGVFICGSNESSFCEGYELTSQGLINSGSKLVMQPSIYQPYTTSSPP